eukprot:12396950-Prorocentrum_lima.AAC.1
MTSSLVGSEMCIRDSSMCVMLRNKVVGSKSAGVGAVEGVLGFGAVLGLKRSSRLGASRFLLMKS